MNEVQKAVAKARSFQHDMLGAIDSGALAMADLARRLRDSNMATARFEKGRAARTAVPYLEVVDALKQADFIIHMMASGVTNPATIDYKKLDDGIATISDTLRRIKNAPTS